MVEQVNGFLDFLHAANVAILMAKPERVTVRVIGVIPHGVKLRSRAVAGVIAKLSPTDNVNLSRGGFSSPLGYNASVKK